VAEKGEPIPSHVTQTVESIADMHVRAIARLSRHQRSIEWFTSQLGRPVALYIIATLVVGWVALNVALLATGRTPLDRPPFSYLQGAATVAALLTTTIVLTSQNRQMHHADQRAQLDLQVNLLVDAKVTKLIALVEELRRDLPSVPDRRDTLAEEMKETVAPHVMLEVLEQSLEGKRDEGGPRK
jgi:uncharacterized membrane protein